MTWLTKKYTRTPESNTLYPVSEDFLNTVVFKHTLLCNFYLLFSLRHSFAKKNNVKWLQPIGILKTAEDKIIFVLSISCPHFLGIFDILLALSRYYVAVVTFPKKSEQTWGLKSVAFMISYQ